MSKSATFERPWGFKGTFKLGEPVTPGDIVMEIEPNCKCTACETNRRYLKQFETNKKAAPISGQNKQNL